MEDEDEEQNSGSEEFGQSPSDEDNQNDNQGDRDDGEADNKQNGGQEVKEVKSSSNVTSQPPPPSDLSATIERTRIEERKKGIAVSHQMVCLLSQHLLTSAL